MHTSESKKQIINVVRCVHGISAGGLLAVSMLSGNLYGVLCSACGCLYYLVWLRLGFMAAWDEGRQRAGCRPIGFLMLPPSLGLAGAGLSLLVWNQAAPMDAYAVAGIVAAGFLVAGLVAHFIVCAKAGGPAGRFLRLATLACLSAPVSIVTVLFLGVGSPEETQALGCMTAVLFGVLGIAAALDMIMVSRCGYGSTRASLRMVSAWIREKRRYLPHFMAAKDISLVLGKSLLALLTMSFFMLANALYSVGMGIGRHIAYKMPAQSREKQVASYRRVGVIISLSSVCYVLYSVRLLFGESTSSYPMVAALIIAMYTFAEFGVNIREAIRLRKSHALEARALRALSFASTLLCFVLTQTAIMSFASEGNNNRANALAGIIFGGLATLVGVYVIVNSIRYAKHSGLAAAGKARE